MELEMTLLIYKANIGLGGVYEVILNIILFEIET